MIAPCLKKKKPVSHLLWFIACHQLDAFSAGKPVSPNTTALAYC